MDRVIVTGGCGFIGSNLVDKLVELGNEVLVIDDLSADAHESFYYNDEAKYIEVDVCSDAMEGIFTAFKPRYVFHLAAESRIQPTLDDPLKACTTNVTGTCNILQASRNANVERVIYSSTSSAYGLKNEPPLREDMPTDCLNPYSITKVVGESLCKMYYDLWGLETIIFRYFNVYGERQPTKGQYAPVIGLFLRQKENNQPMTVVGDGLQTRDYAHVSDVVHANVLAATATVGFGEVHNIGTGNSYSVLDIIDMIGGEFKHIPPRLGESRHTKADNTKAKENLGWEPTVNLKDWINEQKN
jgi:UDP-glucose 4-epimerase